MNLYAESSAVLAWILGEPDGKIVRQHLTAAKIVISSDLTLVECDRILFRCLAISTVTEADVTDRQALLNRAAASWNILRLDSKIIERARRPFPNEPIRTLDALHLASALIARSILPGISLLSLDRRVTENAKALGFSVFPR